MAEGLIQMKIEENGSRSGHRESPLSPHSVMVHNRTVTTQSLGTPTLAICSAISFPPQQSMKAERSSIIHRPLAEMAIVRVTKIWLTFQARAKPCA